MARVTVVGGGLAGLSAGFRLRRAGHAVTVLEAAEAVGGKLAASRGDGWAINRGAQLIPGSYAATLAIARDAGALTGATPFNARLAVLRDGREHALHSAGAAMVRDGLRTRLVSPRAKLRLGRLAADLARHRGALGYDAQAARAAVDGESVRDYCARRLDAELRDYVINPLLRGLFLCDADAMPILDFLFTARRLLGAPMLRYPAGIDVLPRALAGHLDVRLGTPVERVARDGDGVAVSAGGVTERADGCVIALDGPSVPRVFDGLDARRAAILTAEMGTIAVYGLHFGTRTPVREDIVALAVPRVEREGLGTLTFQHVYSAGSAPPGRGLVSAWFDDAWCAPRRDRDDDALIAEMTAIVRTVAPEVVDAAEFSRLDRWDPATPRSVPGYHALTAELVALADPRDRVQLAGDYLNLGTINGAVVAGEAAAARLARALAA